MDYKKLLTPALLCLSIGLFLIVTPGCKKDKTNVPELSTAGVNNIDVITAGGGGTVISDEGAPVTARGVCWSTGPYPTIDNNKTSDGNGTGSFTSFITGLEPNTLYYVRAYATNKEGTNYGEPVSFTTLDGMVDIDGNVYHVVTIGTQTWTVENLRVLHYTDGTPIENRSNLNTAIPAHCFYMDNDSIGAIYGPLYNWYAVNTGKLVPEGWHIPARIERFAPENGGDYKETGTVHWEAPNSEATNITGFTALPGGYWWEATQYRYLGQRGYWWMTTEYDDYNAFCIYMDYAGGSVTTPLLDKGMCISVRCLKD
ncbi:MAG: hypothetical protein JXJ22_14290 [Bacteroidales bacterium]|nr:hypothetical protein [Bacteroidales bacterium]